MSGFQVVVTDAALNALLEARLAAIGAGAAGLPSNMESLEKHGSFASGVADPAVDGPALLAALNALAALGGGTIELYHNYSVSSEVAVTGDNYANIGLVGKTPTAGFTRTLDNGSSDGSAILKFTGATTYGLKHLVFDGVTFTGHSTSDYTKLLSFNNVDGVDLRKCRFVSNAVEGLYFNTPASCRNARVVDCYAENVGQGAQKLSAYNLNVDGCLFALSKAINCGVGVEQTGRNARLVANHIENCVFAGMLLFSTWASWVDLSDLTTVHSSNNAIVEGNTYIGMAAAIKLGDSGGHVDHGITVPGNAGALSIIGNNFYTCTLALTGGSDRFKVTVYKNNYHEDSLTADNAALDWQKGWLDASDNTYVLGATSSWSGILRIGDRDPVNTRATIKNTKIIGKCWTGAAVVLGPDVEEIGTRFLGITPGAEAYRRLAGSNYNSDGGLSSWSLADPWLVQDDDEFVYSPWQTSRIKVHGTVPTKGTWKVGDRAMNADGTGAMAWRCVLAGTADTILSGVTATTTASSTTAAFAGATKLTKYQWVTIAGVSGRYQLTAFDPSTGVATIAPAAAGGITAAAVTFAPPSWEVASVMASKAVAAAYVVTPLDQLIYYSTPGAYAITLPAAATSEGRIFRFAKADAAANALTLTAAGSDTINGAGTFAPVTTQYQITHVYCMGGKWYAHDDGVTGGGGGAVSTVFGRAGAVTAQANDYSYGQLSGKPSTIAGISAGVASDFVTQLEATGDARYIQLGAAIADSEITDSPFFTIASPGATPSVVWTGAHRQQVMTLTTNATVTISAIPAGGSLLLRVFQSATGGPYALAHAVSGLGTLFPDLGVAPIMSNGAGKFDDYLYRFDGTRTVYTRVLTGAG